MGDYISREAAIEDFEYCTRKNSTWTPQRVKTLLMRIPAADVEPVHYWIPCSDRLPEERGCYLVAVKRWYDGKPVTREAVWNGADWISCEKWIRMEITPRVTHWQPLPEPPEEEQSTAKKRKEKPKDEKN